MRFPGYTTRLMISFLFLSLLATFLTVANSYRLQLSIEQIHARQATVISGANDHNSKTPSQEIAISKTKNALKNNLLFSGFIIGLSVLMAGYTNLTLRKPLAGLLAATHHIAKGRFDHRINVSGVDELGRLISAFDTMTAELYHKDLQITGQLEQLKKTKSLLESNSEDLEKKNKEMEYFIYTVSHDLKAPLIAIQGFLAVLADEFGTAMSPKASFYLDRVQANSEQMQTLIQQLLELSRAGQAVKHLSLFSTRHIIQQVIDNLHLQIKAKNARISLRGHWPDIVGEPIRIKQALANLIDNALHYSQANAPVKIELSVASLANKWRFKVKDNGVGIEPAYQARVFDMFERLGNSTEKNPLGTGIGLAIVKKIAESHSGNVGVRSKPGRGSTFYFDISKELKQSGKSKAEVEG